MEYLWILLSVFLQLTVHPGNAKPTITPAERHLVIELNKPFELHCRGEKEMQWQREDRPTQRQRGEKRVVGMSSLHISRAQPVHMGRYICLEKSSGERASIYIYVRDPDNPFRKSMVFNILTRVGENASISCLATDPSLDNLHLETCSSSALAPGLHYSASLEHGVVIHDTQKAYEGCYVCTGKLGERHIRSHDYHLTVIPVPVAPPVIEMQAYKRMILTRNESLSLTCNTTNVNGDIKLQWVTPPGSGAVWYPQQPAKIEGASRILTENFTHMRSSTLQIGAVGPRDAGSYRCEAENGRGVSTQSVWLDVYDKGFINLTLTNNRTIHVRSGESLTLSVDMEAYPKPHTFSWRFMGHALQNTTDHVITTHSHEYRHSSELRLVRLKMSEGGVYTFRASNGDASVNQTFTIFVTSKPEIVSHEGPVDGQVRCVAEGFPAPQITWYYCEQPYIRCSQQVNATQEEHNVITVTLFSPMFGKTEVESRVNVSRGRFTTLECVASVEGEQAYTLFSISEDRSPRSVHPSANRLRVSCRHPLSRPHHALLQVHAGGSYVEADAESEMFEEDGLSLDTEDLLSFSYQVAKGMEFLASKNVSINFILQMYQIMRSCWEADPFNRPPFRKVVERIEQQLSDATKHIYLNFSLRLPVTPRDREEPSSQGTAFHRLNSAGTNSVLTQPLLVQHEVFLEGTTLTAQRVKVL
ncbi:hypothetical protein INR49_008541 [Caranx melampygus]|nr:hypothetical protein INR49_008541 [Caranx melampygus]